MAKEEQWVHKYRSGNMWLGRSTAEKVLDLIQAKSVQRKGKEMGFLFLSNTC